MKKETIQIRVNPIEKYVMTRYAEMSGMTLSDSIRMMHIGNMRPDIWDTLYREYLEKNKEGVT